MQTTRSCSAFKLIRITNFISLTIALPSTVESKHLPRAYREFVRCIYGILFYIGIWKLQRAFIRFAWPLLFLQVKREIMNRNREFVRSIANTRAIDSIEY